MRRPLILIASLLTSGCSTTIVYSPKYIIVEDSKEVGVDADITGSDLRDAEAKQESDGDFKIPAVGG